MSESDYIAAAELPARGLPPPRTPRGRRAGVALGIGMGTPAWAQAPVEMRRRKTPQELAAQYPADVMGDLQQGRRPRRPPELADDGPAYNAGNGNGPGALRDAVREYHEERGSVAPADIEDDRLERLRRGDEPRTSPPGMGPVPGARAGAGSGDAYAGVDEHGNMSANAVIADKLRCEHDIDLGPGPIATDADFKERLYLALIRKLGGGAARQPGSPPPGPATAPPAPYYHNL
jgi:hypothetical protein